MVRNRIALAFMLLFVATGIVYAVPSVSDVSITPYYAQTTDDLLCSMTVADTGSGELTIRYNWTGCTNGGGVCDLQRTGSCTPSGGTCSISDTLNSPYTGGAGSVIYCNVMEVENSTGFTVGGQTESVTILSSPPTISTALVADVDNRPDADQIVNSGDQIRFVTRYTDPDGTYSPAAPTEQMFICNESTCYHCSISDYSDCIAYNLDAYNDSERYINSSIFTVPEGITSYTFYVRIWDGTNYSTNDMQSYSFSLNGLPYASNVVVYPATAYENNTLSCNYSYNDPDDDLEAAPTSYRWYREITGSWTLMSVETRTLSNPILGAPYFEVGDRLMCGVKVTDARGSSDDIFVNSTAITILGNTQPSILSYTDNSDNSSERINVGEDVMFEVNWTDPNDGDRGRLFVCSNDHISSSGCSAEEFCRSSISAEIHGTSIISTCNYTAQNTDASSETYYVGVCDAGGRCNVSGPGSFFVNHAPIILSIDMLIDRDNSTTDANLNCSVIYNPFDQDNEPVSLTYRWNVNRSGTVFDYDAPDHNIVTHGNTQNGDEWRCNVTPFDGIAYGNSVLTPWMLIYNSDMTGGKNPWIVEFNVSSEVVTGGEKVEFTVDWDDSDSTEEIQLYICNSSHIDKTGCFDGIFNETNWTSVSPLTVSYTVKETDTGDMDYWLMVCDDTGADERNVGGDWLCSDYGTLDPNSAMGSFEVNQKPVMTSINLRTTEGDRNFSYDQNLECSATYTDMDSSNATIFYNWEINFTTGRYYQGYYVTYLKIWNITDGTLSKDNIEIGDTVQCKAFAQDEYSDSSMIYSPVYTIDSGMSRYPRLEQVSDDVSGRIDIGAVLNFTIDWSGIERMAIYICNSSRVIETGCLDHSFGIEWDVSDPALMPYTVEEWLTGEVDYYIYGVDMDSGNLSDVATGSFEVNHVPTIGSVDLISDESNNSMFTDNSNLICDIKDPVDSDGDMISYTFKWFLDRGGVQEFETSPTTSVITKGNVMWGDKWRCEAIPADVDSEGISVDSGWIEVSEEIDGTPVVLSVSDDTEGVRANVGEDVIFNITWNDSDSTEVRAYVCNSTRIYESGCYDYEFGRQDFTSADPLYVTYTVAGDISGSQDYWVMVCDDSIDGWKCSSYQDAMGNLTLNSDPDVINNITILSSKGNFTNDANLICEVGYDSVDSDGDEVTIIYNWYYSSNLTGQYGSFVLNAGAHSKYLTHENVEDHYRWKCEGVPFDGFAYGIGVMSDAVQIVPLKEDGQGSNIPTVISVSDSTTVSDPVNDGSEFDIDISIADNDSLEFRVYICNSSRIYDSGCWDHQFGWASAGRVSYTQTLDVQITVEPETWMDTQTTYYVMACDETHKCSNVTSDEFVMNHRPKSENIQIINRPWATHTQITPSSSEPRSSDIFNCTFEYNPNDVGLSDDYLGAIYIWYNKVNGSSNFNAVQSADSKEIAAAFIKGDTIMCAVNVLDELGLYTSYFQNSSPILIKNGAPLILMTIVPSFPEADDPVVCNYEIADPDYDNVNHTVEWYINGIHEPAPSGSQTLYSSYTEVGDNVTCVVKATDGKLTSIRSRSVIVDQTFEENETVMSSTPYITSINTTPGMIDEDKEIKFNVGWNDFERENSSELARLYICTTDNVDAFGCVDGLYCYSDFMSTNVSCSFNVTADTKKDAIFYAAVCDDSNRCSNATMGNFTTNRRPNSTVTIDPDEVSEDLYDLSCDTVFMDVDNDTAGNIEYMWYYRFVGGEFQQTMNTRVWTDVSTSEGDAVFCSARVSDVHGLKDRIFRNSSIYVFEDSVFVPTSSSSGGGRRKSSIIIFEPPEELFEEDVEYAEREEIAEHNLSDLSVQEAVEEQPAPTYIPQTGFESVTGDVIADEGDFAPISFIAFLGVFALILGIVMYDVSRKQVKVSEDTEYDQMLGRLDEYVGFMLEQGHGEYLVKKMLVDEGWNPDVVDESIDKHSVRLE